MVVYCLFYLTKSTLNRHLRAYCSEKCNNQEELFFNVSLRRLFQTVCFKALHVVLVLAKQYTTLSLTIVLNFYAILQVDGLHKLAGMQYH